MYLLGLSMDSVNPPTFLDPLERWAGLMDCRVRLWSNTWIYFWSWVQPDPSKEREREREREIYILRVHFDLTHLSLQNTIVFCYSKFLLLLISFSFCCSKVSNNLHNCKSRIQIPVFYFSLMLQGFYRCCWKLSL